MYVVYVVGGILVFWFFYMETKYRIRVTVKDVVKSTVLIKQYKARYWTDRDKVAFWKLAGERNRERKLLDLPPEESIELDHKGRKYAENQNTDGNK
jgi:hypothetical protein